MAFFDTPTDGTRLHFVDYGPAEGPVLVFVSGSYFGTEMWERQMLPLAAEGHRCVALDRRGHGRSDDVWGGYDPDTLADDIAALLDHLDLRKVTLVGHSVGAVEAVRCVSRHGGGRVARLALVAGMAPGIVRTADHPEGLAPEFIAAANETFRRDRSAFFVDSADEFFARHLPGNELSDAFVRHMVDLCHVATPRAASALLEIFLTLDMVTELPKIDVPALVVHGTHDASAPFEATGRRTAALIPDSTLKTYENAAHGLFATHAERLNADLREFTGR